MPLVRIDILQRRSSEELAAIGQAVHDALVEAIGIPVLDRFHILTEHPPGGLVYDPLYLDIPRTDGVVFIQVTLSVGRTLEQKRALYSALSRHLEARAGVRPQDVFVNLVEVLKENWSFGNGQAQYAP